MGKLFDIQNLSVTLQGKYLYKNLNFTLNEADRYIYWGPNGCGKSLLLELIFFGHNQDIQKRYKGLKLESGQILDKEGRDLLNPANHDFNTMRKVVYLSQTEEPYRNLTVKEQCMQSCNSMQITWDESKLDYLLGEFGLKDKKNKKIGHRLSPGEGKIIHIISRILKLKVADIFLLDEPLNYLSFHNSKVFNKVMTEEIKQNPALSMIMISHCKAATFPTKAMEYNNQNHTVTFPLDYQAYNCFSDVGEIR
ncbi:ATP-binding cassette domain-containing protein [Candidatus Avelusimicrobium fimicolum]|uniref:ATP-binding cassette domain-containing protein n=1 Tax=Candidatus Avelusimicrobium fimicolum TaxID=3416216 RepID=UPI003D0A2951